jgi:hypothetical protein
MVYLLAAASKSGGLSATTWLAIIGVAVTTVGIGIEIYTLVKVRSVARAQSEARALTQELLNIDQIELNLVRVIKKLHDINDKESNRLAGDLNNQLGRIQGARRTFEEGGRRRIDIGSMRIEKGFFDEAFLGYQINNANTAIDIVTGRTKLVAGFYVFDRLRQACERGVQVRIIGLSDEAPNEILADAAKTVSSPAPANAADYRKQIESNKEDILNGIRSWSPAAQSYIEYWVNKSVPRISVLRSDNVVNFGFLQLYRDAQPAELKDREYLQFTITSGTGIVLLRHIELAIQESEQLFPDVEDALATPEGLGRDDHTGIDGPRA